MSYILHKIIQIFSTLANLTHDIPLSSFAVAINKPLFCAAVKSAMLAKLMKFSKSFRQLKVHLIFCADNYSSNAQSILFDVLKTGNEKENDQKEND